MRKFIIITTLSLTLSAFISLSSNAGELTKGIHYLGMGSSVKSYEITCSNGKKGEVYVDTNTKEVKIKKEDGYIQDLGQISFGDAVRKVCR